jgi:hypothetical protein
MQKAILSLFVWAVVAGCSAKRWHGDDRSIQSYDYCVVTEESANGYYDQAASILGQSFVVIGEHDPRLLRESIRDKTCKVSINWTRGFWTTTGWVEVTDYESGNDVLLSQTRRGMLWMGANGNVLESIHDIASARSEGPPIDQARVAAEKQDIEALVEGSSGGQRSVEDRLTELKQLHDRGVINRQEYDQSRSEILKDL